MSSMKQQFFRTVTVMSLLFVFVFQLVVQIPIALANENEVSNPFRDIDSSFAKTNILIAYDAGFINGVTKDRFAPKDVLTLEQLIKMLVTGFNQPLGSSNPSLQGQMSSWAVDYITTAIDRGWITDGEFTSYKDVVTREQAAYVIGKVFLSYGHGFELNKVDVLSFKDRSKIKPKYAPYIGLLNELEVITGVTSTTFDPHGKLTREQGVTLMMRMLSIQLTIGTYAEMYELVNYSEQLKMLNIAYAINPSRYVTNAIGQMLALAGDWSLSLSVYEESVALYGLDRSSAMNFSYAQFKSGQAKLAIQTIYNGLNGEQPNEMERILLSQYAYAIGDKELYNDQVKQLKNSKIPEVSPLAKQLDAVSDSDYWNNVPKTGINQTVNNACVADLTQFDMTLSEFLIDYESLIMNFISFSTLALGILNPAPLGVLMNGVSLIATVGYTTYHLTEGQKSADEYTWNRVGIATAFSGLFSAKFNIRWIGAFSDSASWGAFNHSVNQAASDSLDSLLINNNLMNLYINDYFLALAQLSYAKQEYLRNDDNQETWCKVITSIETKGLPNSLMFIQSGMKGMTATFENYKNMEKIVTLMNGQQMTNENFYQFRHQIMRMESALNIDSEARLSKDLKLRPIVR